MMTEYYRLAFRWENVGFNADFVHHAPDQLGAFFDSIVLARNAGLPNQISELLDKFALLGIDILTDCP
jgi:hypothetical protein